MWIVVLLDYKSYLGPFDSESTASAVAEACASEYADTRSHVTDFERSAFYIKPAKRSQSEETQETLLEAEELLAEALDGTFFHESPRIHLLYSLIISVRVHSASSNSIPALRGLGLETTLALAREVIAGADLSERSVSITNYRHIAEAISI